MKKKNVFLFVFLLVIISGIIFPHLTFAQDKDALVPSGCRTGCPCTLCDLYALGQNIIFFLLYIVAMPIAAIGILYGGVMMITSAGNEKKITSGKRAISNAIIGLAIAFLAWLVIQALLQTLAFQISFGGALRNWNEIPTCGATDTGPGAVSCNTEFPGKSAGGGNGGGGGGGSLNDACTTDGFGTCTSQQKGLLDGTACPDPSIGGEGCSWNQEPRNAAALRSKLDPYDPAIQAAADKYHIPVERLRAIILAESSGENSATHHDLDGGTSYGLMQIRPSTARILDPNLNGLSDAQISAKLQDPSYNIDIGSQYYSTLLGKYGGDKDLASAAYNGGPGANLPSVNCPGQKRWQCGYDNNEHTKPNTGYNPTRNYIHNIDSMEPLLK